MAQELIYHVEFDGLHLWWTSEDFLRKLLNHPKIKQIYNNNNNKEVYTK